MARVWFMGSSSGTWATVTADVRRKRKTNRVICICEWWFFLLQLPSYHHPTENVIIAPPPCVVYDRKDNVCVSVFIGGFRKESVVVYSQSPLDAPCVSLTLSLINRYTGTCWEGQVLLVLSYTPIQDASYTQVARAEEGCYILISSSEEVLDCGLGGCWPNLQDPLLC